MSTRTSICMSAVLVCAAATAVANDLPRTASGKPDLSGTYNIDDTGRVSLPLILGVNTRGLTLAQLEKKIAAELTRNFIVDPKVSIDLVEARRNTGISHLCMRTLGGELDATGHLEALKHIHKLLTERLGVSLSG